MALQATLTQDCATTFAKSSAPPALYRVDPLQDARWDDFLLSHPQASLFHSSPWLRALRNTYGYESIVYSTSAPGEKLQNALVFCRVESWITGRRLVSLPFSDHCAPLLHAPGDLPFFLESLDREAREAKWRYVEFRPLEPIDCSCIPCQPSAHYVFHQLDLRPDLKTLFRNFHRNSIQRKIQRAERERLTYQESSGTSLLNAFYRLMVLTRRRHRVPPQPKHWFRNLCDHFGEALKIRIALHDKRAVAGMLTIRYKNAMVYKYGAADARFNNLGGMHLLYWNTIQDARNLGLKSLDLGRADADQEGLITFKQRWGAKGSKLTYYRLATSRSAIHTFDPSPTSWKMRIAKQAFAHSPTIVLSALGRILYKHIG